MLKRILQVLLALLVVAVLGVAAILLSVYRSGLAMLPSDRAPSTQTFPERVQKPFALMSGYGWPPVYPRLRVSDPLEHVIGIIAGTVPETPFGVPGLALDATRLIIRQRPGNGINHSKYKWQVESAGRIWISRHWTAGQAIDTLLAESHFGDNQVGLVDAAWHYFRLKPDQLDDGELVVLFVARSDPGYYSPWCQKERITEFARHQGYIAPRFDRPQGRLPIDH